MSILPKSFRLSLPIQSLIGCLLSACLLLGPMTSSAQDDEKLTMNMRDADIRALIQWVADNTGKNIIVHKDVKGKVNVLSPEPLTIAQAYQVFLSVLQVHQFAAIETEEALKIVPLTLAASGALPYAGSSPNADMVVTVVKLGNIPASEVANNLRPLLSKDAVISPFKESNALVLADHATSIESALRLIARLDTTSSNEIEVIMLKNADAKSILQSLTVLAPNTSQQNQGLGISFSADERSNSILMAGDSVKRKQFRKLIHQLDTPLNGQGNTNVVYLHYVDAAELVPILQNLSGSLQAGQKETESTISIDASESANALVINAPPSMLNTLKKVITQLDIRRAQVLVEAIIVEVSGDVGSDIGVTWITNPDENIIGAVNTLGDLPLISGGGENSPLDFTPGRGFTFGYFNDGDLQAALRALNATQNTNILSTPTVVAIDNEAASLLVGQNVPFKTGQSTGSSSSTNDPFTTIERQDIGISLNVTPRINQGDSITLEIEQKTENIAPSIDFASDIVTNKREIVTKALIKDGQVLVLGGLISDEETESQEKVPLLGDIPLLGRLFSSKGISHTKKNLMVFIHPTILKDEEHIATLTRQRYDFMQELQKQVRNKEWSADVDDTAVLKDFDTIKPKKDPAP